jgi:hypothetical protein
MNINIELNKEAVEVLISMSFSDEYEGDWKFNMFSGESLIKIIMFTNDQCTKEKRDLQKHKLIILKNCCFLKYLEKVKELTSNEIESAIIDYNINLNDLYFKTKQKQGHFYSNNLSYFFFLKSKDKIEFFSKVYNLSYGYKNMVKDLSKNKVLQQLFSNTVTIDDFRKIDTCSGQRLMPSLMAFIKVTMIDDCQFSNDLVFLEGIKTYKKYFTNYDFYLHLIGCYY